MGITVRSLRGLPFVARTAAFFGQCGSGDNRVGGERAFCDARVEKSNLRWLIASNSSQICDES